MNKCLLSGLLVWLFVLFLFSTFVFAQNVNAASVYDNVIQKGDPIFKFDAEEVGFGNKKVFKYENLHYNYMKYITNKDLWSKRTNSNNPAAYYTYDNIMPKFYEAQERGSGFALSQITYNDNNFNFVRMFADYNFNIFSKINSGSTLSLIFSTCSTASFVDVYKDGSLYTLKPDCSSYGVVLGVLAETKEIGVVAAGTADSIVSSELSGVRKRYVFVNYDINYPEGYEGLKPSKVLDREKIIPNFRYELVDKQFTAKVYNHDLPNYNPGAGYSFVNWRVFWDVYRCNDGYDESEPLTSRCKNSELVHHSTPLMSEDFKFTFDSYAWYRVQAKFAVEQCFRYASYPATPDHCVYVSLSSEPQLSDYEFEDRIVYLNVDGTTSSGDTSQQDCNAAGFCPPVDPCSLESTWFGVLTCRMYRQHSFGIIVPSLQGIIRLFNSFKVPVSPTCALSLPNTTLPGGAVFQSSSLVQNACASANKFRQMFPVITAAVNAVIAFIVLFLLIRIVNTILNRYKTDIFVDMDGGSK